MTVDWKKKLIPNLPYLLFVYLFDKLCQAVRLAPGLDASEKFLHLSQGFTEAFSSGLPSLHPLDLLAGIAGAVIVRLAVYAKSKNTKKYRKGIEYGSARWGTAADIAPYVDPVPDWNIPLTQTEKLTMSSRPKNPKYARNKNILVIGGSGSGKTRFFVKPSLIPYTAQMIATLTRHQIGTVERALEIFRQLGLVEQLDSGAFYMTDIELMIGQSSTEAERKRAARLENKALLPPRTKGGHWLM